MRLRSALPAGVAAIIAVAVLAGCGGGVRTARQEAAEQNQGASTCGAKAGYVFILHRVDCEVANTLIVMLNDRARRSTITVADSLGDRGTWVCTFSPPVVGPLHCHDGDRFFTVEHAPR